MSIHSLSFINIANKLYFLCNDWISVSGFLALIVCEIRDIFFVSSLYVNLILLFFDDETLHQIGSPHVGKTIFVFGEQ